jgi:hypothetical protein
MIATKNKEEQPGIKCILPHRLWNATLDVIERTNPFLHSYLIDGQLLGIENEYIRVGYALSKTDQMEMVDNKKNHQTIEEAFGELGYPGFKLQLEKTKPIRPTVMVESFTPHLAKLALDKNVKNRRISNRAVALFAAEMKRGEWHSNGESIKFDSKGRFIDGQHRLQAVIKSNTTQEFVVVRNLSPDDSTFATIDAGRKRTATAVLAMEGTPNSHALASIISFYHLCRANLALDKELRLSSQQILSTYRNDPEDWSLAASCAGNVKALIRKPPYGVFAYLARKVNPDAFNKFHESLKTGAGLEFDSPILALRNYLLNGNARRRSNNEAVRLCEFNACVNGWNHWRSGNKGQYIKANETKPNLDLI